jgi:DNA-binding MarR family transcriptional regulator
LSDVSQEDYETLAEFRYALRKFTEFSGLAAKAVGLPPQQHQAMMAIRGTPKGSRVTVGWLAERLCSKPQSTSELLSRMERQGLVVRHSSTTDGRQVWVELTDSGRAILDGLASVHREELRRVRPELEKLLNRL